MSVCERSVMIIVSTDAEEAMSILSDSKNVVCDMFKSSCTTNL